MIVEEKEWRWRQWRRRPTGAAEGMREREGHRSREEGENGRGEATGVGFRLELS